MPARRFGGRGALPRAITAFRRALAESLEKRRMLTVVFQAPAFQTASDHMGVVLNNPQVQLVFWGSGWDSAGALGGQLSTAVRDIVSPGNGYLSGLQQYRHLDVSTAAMAAPPVHISDLQYPLPAGPLDDAAVGQMLQAEIPSPAANTLYFVVPPPGTTGTTSGGHNFGTAGGGTFYYGWMANDSHLDTLTRVFSQELVGAITDADGMGFQINPRSSSAPSWNDISSPAPGTNYSYRLNDADHVLVQPYFSTADQAYLGPDNNADRLSVDENGVLTITGDQGGIINDDITIDSQNNDVVATLNNQKETLHAVTMVVVNPGLGANSIEVHSTIMPTQIHGQGTDVVTVGDNSAGVSGIAASLVVDNGAGYSTLNVDDSADATAQTVQMSGDGMTEHITFSAPTDSSMADIAYAAAGVKAVNLTTGRGNDMVAVQSAAGNPGGVITTLDSAGGNDSIDVGGTAAGLQSIAGRIIVRDSASAGTTASSLVVDDASDGVSRALALDGITGVPGDPLSHYGSIMSIGLGEIDYRSDQTSAVTVKLPTRGGNTINVFETGVPTTISDGGANDSINVTRLGSAQGVTYPLTVEDASAVLAVDDSQDSTDRAIHLMRAADPAYSRLQGMTPADILYPYQSASLVTLTLGAGGTGNVVNVDATGRPTELIGGTIQVLGVPRGVPDTINVATVTHNARPIAGALSIENPGQEDLITIDSSSDTISRLVVLNLDAADHPNDTSWQRITGLATAPIEYEAADAAAVTVLGGSGDNTYEIQKLAALPKPADTFQLSLGGGNDSVRIDGTDAGSNLAITGQGGADDFRIGATSHTVQGIAGPITIEDPAGGASLTVDDSADSGARHVTLGVAPPAGDTDPFGTVVGLGPAPITYEARDLNSPVTVMGGGGGNTFHVDGIPESNTTGGGGPGIDLDTGSGNDNVMVTATGAGTQLSIDGQAGDNAITVDFSAGTIAGDISVTGGAGSNSLQITGANPADSFDLAAGAVQHGSTLLSYTAIHTLTLDPGTFRLNSDLDGMSLDVAGSTVDVRMPQHLAGLNIDAARVTLDQTTGSPIPIFVSALTIMDGGQLDLSNNSLEVDYAPGHDPIANIRAYVASGYQGNGSGIAWSGPGIISGSALAEPGHGLGIADGAHITVKWALYGDANLDGSVGFADLLSVAQHYGRGAGTATWDQGDFTYDGNVDFVDLLRIAQNYGKSDPSVAIASPLVSLDGVETRLKARHHKVGG